MWLIGRQLVVTIIRLDWLGVGSRILPHYCRPSAGTRPSFESSGKASWFRTWTCTITAILSKLGIECSSPCIRHGQIPAMRSKSCPLDCPWHRRPVCWSQSAIRRWLPLHFPSHGPARRALLCHTPAIALLLVLHLVSQMVRTLSRLCAWIRPTYRN